MAVSQHRGPTGKRSSQASLSTFSDLARRPSTETGIRAARSRGRFQSSSVSTASPSTTERSVPLSHRPCRSPQTCRSTPTRKRCSSRSVPGKAKGMGYVEWDPMTARRTPTDLLGLEGGARYRIVVIGRGPDDVLFQFAFDVDVETSPPGSPSTSASELEPLRIAVGRPQSGSQVNFHATYGGAEIPLESIETPGSDLEYPTVLQVSMPVGTPIIVESDADRVSVFQTRTFEGRVCLERFLHRAWSAGNVAWTRSWRVLHLCGVARCGWWHGLSGRPDWWNPPSCLGVG